MLEVTSLGSGSCGNALLVRTADAAVLIDCGVSVRRMTRALAAKGLDLSAIDALLLSHEHSDHISELGRFVSRGTTILSTKGTAAAARVLIRAEDTLRPLRPVTVAGIDVIPIPVSHDAAEPCGFLLRSTAGSIAMMTDLGAASSAAADAISEADLVVLEANHDVGLLRRGPYPQHLQRRILSELGHLSNDDCAALLLSGLRGSRRPPTVWLAHLSETNNRPHLAAQTVRRQLSLAGIQVDIHALPRRDISQTWRAGDARHGVAQLSLGLPGLDAELRGFDGGAI
jgi:phosphoribosyl 1,2-cyclic phosphodiesterase